MKNCIIILLTLVSLFGLIGNTSAQNVRDLSTTGQTINPQVTVVAQTVLLTLPNGGESWTANTIRNITWMTTGTVTNVQIEYSVNAGVTYSLISPNAPNTGIYAWTVPNTPTASARVRISDASNLTVTDQSNLLFTIVGGSNQTVQVLSPNGGETMNAGVTRNITWTTTGTVANVQIEYSVNGGVVYSVITSSTPNTGSYIWTVPNTPTASARIRISDASNLSKTDQSNLLFTIVGGSNQTVQVLSPNGGETMNAGDVRNVTWTTTGTVANVQIEYSVNGGVVYSVITSSAPNTGSYTWIVPNTPTASARVRISDASNLTKTDQSNLLFTIVGGSNQTVQVLSPNGGETMNAGDVRNVTWTTTGTVANVQIEYSVNGGVVYSVITSSAPNTGSYLWTVPNTPTASGRVRISDASNLTKTDQSNLLFTIVGGSNQTVQVLSPNGGETMNAGVSRNITWTTTGTVAYVQIEYSVNGGVVYSVITSSTPNTGSYLWTVPNTPTASGRVRISDASNLTKTDQSNLLFTIVASALPTVTVMSPNGGESWTVGTSRTITWSSTGTFANAQIEYSLNAGAIYYVVTSSTPNTGSYTWTVPNTPTASGRVRVSNAVSPSVTNDVSNLLFTISAAPAPSLTLTTPNGGENLVIGSGATITWVTNGTIANVKLEYSINNGGTYSNITTSTPNTGSFLWTVPNSATASARVRVSNVANPTVTNDVSDANFSIVNASTPTITLTSPNGGEAWTLGSIRTLTWTTTGVPTFNVVVIEYSTNGENGTYSPISTFAQNTGSYQWVVPTTLTSTARVRVTTVVNEVQARDISDANFAITPALLLTVTSPNGFESWTIGSTQNLTWSSAGTIDNVKIEYSTDGNLSFSLVTASTPNTGSYAWVVPSPITTRASIRISDVANSATIKDLSNAFFNVIPPAPSITLTSPNGGENWLVGSTGTITWTSTGTLANVRVEYSTNAGISYNVINGSTPNTGSYTWSVLNTPTTFARVRVADVSNPSTIVDASDLNFTIATSPNPVLTVLSPNGGENLVIGSQSAINWSSTGNFSNVRLEYSLNAGVTFSLITVNAPNTGTYLWAVPNSATASARIRASDASNPLVTTDMSDANFSIINSNAPTMTMTSPNGGEDWSVGSVKIITWSTTGLPSYAVVKIEYSSTGANGAFSVITTGAANSGHYTWVPTSPVTSFGRIRVSSLANEVPASDMSDADFTVSASPSITVTSPNGGEHWSMNSTKTITWTSTGTMANVKLEYSLNGSTTFYLVTASTPNTGNYTWVVSGPVTSYGIIRVSDALNASIKDGSNATFYVTTEVPTISLTSPNGGETYAVGSTNAITWNTSGTIANVRLEFSTNAGSTYLAITGSAPNTGSYMWTAPNSPGTFNRIRVSDVSNVSTLVDASDANFTIVAPPTPTVTVLLPNGGENFVIGSNQTINWTSTGVFTNVRLEYSTNAGVEFSLITVSAPNTGSFVWTVPNSATASARIRVSDAVNSNLTTDVSNANFAITNSTAPTMTMTSPNGGEDWSVGSVRTITWTTTGLPSFAVVKIEYSVVGANGPYTVITTGAANSGHYTWVPTSPTTTLGCFRVSSVANEVPTSDISDNNFTISPSPSITVTSPNGGENWSMNSTKTITWNSTGTMTNVKLEYSINGAITYALLAASVPNTGSYTWVVPGPVTNYASVRVSDASNSLVKDVSNTVFIISTLTPGNAPIATRDNEIMLNAIPTVFSLEQNYPNPFNPTTMIQYSVPSTQYVTIKIYNVLGNEVAVLVDGIQEAGYKSVTWDPSNLTSGIYYYKLTAGEISEVRKMLYVR